MQRISRARFERQHIGLSRVRKIFTRPASVSAHRPRLPQPACKFWQKLMTLPLPRLPGQVRPGLNCGPRERPPGGRSGTSFSICLRSGRRRRPAPSWVA